MHCPQCHADNPDQASACLQCGAALALTCPQCGTELPPQANFCFHCGSPVMAPPAQPDEETLALLQRAVQRLAPQGYADRLLATRGQVARERRTVTMLFCDVQGSTSLAESLDPEEMMDIMDGAFDVLIPPIYRYEGTVARLMGDAVLAFFGAPIAHEDDPACACRAALDIVEQAGGYAEKLQDERGLAGFNVRVGIHTGPVVVGEVGSDLRVEYTAMGDAVNLAQRLQSTAAPGTVLISGDTQRLVAPLFETEALGEVALRGRAQPVAVYRVVAAKEVERKPRGIAGLDSPLVGREAEMAALQGAIERLQGGQGGIVTIVGEAGIGKSRLVAELRKGVMGQVRGGHPEGTEGPGLSGEEILRFAQNDNSVPLQWVEGRCLSYSGSIAYQLWTDVLRHLLGIEADASPDRVRQSLRERVQALCPDRSDELERYLANMMALPLQEEEETQLAELSGEQIRAATFDAVQALIECTACQQPLVLVCEDIYWSDPTSMELLEKLLPLIEHLPLLLICVFRPRKGHPSWRVREAAARDYAQRHTDLWLQSLPEGHSQQLVSNLLPMPAVPETLQQRILERAEGNPFYVEEIIRALIAQGALAQDGSGQWSLTRNVAGIAIPDTLNGVLTARIDQLSDDTRRVLQVAAVIGRLFTYPVLAAIAHLDGQLDPHLVALQEAELIRERVREPERQYIFKHELTREAAYNGLLKKERRVLHRQVAEALERLFPERVEEQLGLLAHHWERAGDADKAINYSLRAGDRARLAFALQEAIAHLQRALALAEEHGRQPQAARAWMKLGLTYHGAGEFLQARRAYDQGFAVWQQAAAQKPLLPPSPAPHAFRMDWFGEPATLDPAGWRDYYHVPLLDHLFSALLQYTPDMDVVPDVAQSWDVLDNGSRYVFHLRDDVRWSDGHPVTAADFEFAWKRLADPVSAAPAAGFLCDIKGVEAVCQGHSTNADPIGVRATDDLTLEVELARPAPDFLLMAAYLCPVPRHAVQANGPAWAEPGRIVTCGPFRLESWQRGQSMVLVRDPDYHGSFEGNVERVVLDLGYDPIQQLQMYERDQLDVFFPEALPQTEMRRAQRRHPDEYVTVPRLTTMFLGLDITRPPFDDIRVRRAISLALDRGGMAGMGRGSTFLPVTGGYIPPGAPGHSPGIAPSFDPPRARWLLAEAGYPGGRGFPKVTFYFAKPGEDLCRSVQAQLRDNLGIEIDWKTLEWGSYFERLISDPPQMWSLARGLIVPDPYWLLIGHYLPYWWHDALVERLANEARATLDRERRLELYQQADLIIMEKMPVVVLFYGISQLLIKPWVKRFRTAYIKSTFWKDVILEPH